MSAKGFGDLEQAMTVLMEITERPAARDQLLAEVLLLRGLLCHRFLHQSGLIDFTAALFYAQDRSPLGALVRLLRRRRQQGLFWPLPEPPAW